MCIRDRTGTALGRVGTRTAGHHGFGLCRQPDAGVGGAGDSLFSAGLAHQLFCEPQFEFPQQLEAGGRGVDAGRVADNLSLIHI